MKDLMNTKTSSENNNLNVDNTFNGFAPSRWMTDDPFIRSQSLNQITLLGSHDSGMCIYRRDSALVHKGNVITQTCDIRQQLEYGVRYFDIRPVMSNDGDFYCGHFSNLSVFGWQGACGLKLHDVIDQINDFCQNKKELIILNICGQGSEENYINIDNHYKDFEPQDYGYLIDRLRTTNNRCTCNKVLMPHEGLVSPKSIGELTVEKSVVIIRDKRNFCHGEFCTQDELPIYNHYAGTDDYVKMRDDQFNKMITYANNPNELFLLSWTLTQKGLDVVYKPILELAAIANSHIEEISSKVESTRKFPNIVYLDKIDNYDGFICIQKINELRKNN